MAELQHHGSAEQAREQRAVHLGRDTVEHRLRLDARVTRQRRAA
jgi:hypothetical protein